ncbi:MAG: hypothetical protein Q8936_15890 [Bacillota bacterium]|nr:hypothetical protein [Bacillota bacterium]
MNIEEIVFDNYVICPLCKERMKSLSGAHLKYKHGYSGLKEFKIEFGIPMHKALVSNNVRNEMINKGKSRANWFRENVMKKGIEYTKSTYSKKMDVVPKEIRIHAGKLRKGQPNEWTKKHISDMAQKGWLDLHIAAEIIGISYNYTRKCASDGRLQVIIEKGIRFTKKEWIDEAIKLLEKNRIRCELYRKQFGQMRKKD